MGGGGSGVGWGGVHCHAKRHFSGLAGTQLFQFFSEFFFSNISLNSKYQAVTIRPFGLKCACIMPRESQKATSITLPADGDRLNF